MARVVYIFIATALGGRTHLVTSTSTPCLPVCQALPLRKLSPCSESAAREQSIIWKDGDEVCIRIARRKNRPSGSGTMRRKCTCAGGVATCAVHTLWEKYFRLLDDGAKPWEHIAAGTARTHLRQTVNRLEIPDADKYGTHDFRRGHAEARLLLISVITQAV